MTAPVRWWRRLQRAWRRDEIDRGLGEEIQFHIDRETEKNMAHGMTPDQARRAALVRFGGVEALRERTRDEFRPALVQDFWRDMKIGARLLRRSPAFAAIAIATIGLGIGAATAVFSVLNGVLLKPLPYPDSGRIVRVFQLDNAGKRSNVSEPNFDDWQALTHGFQSMAEMASWGSVPVVGGTEPTMASATLVSRQFFDVMGTAPALGRAFSSDEQKVDGAPAAIVSHAFWKRWLGDDAAFGRRGLRIGDRVYAVVGVMPEAFDYPNGTAIWLARELNPRDLARTAHSFQVIARLRDGTSLESAQAELSRVSRELKSRYGDETWMSDAAAVPLLEQLTAASRPALQVLFGAALLLLVIANTNVSSLLLARAAARRHEFAVQLAIGAGRARIARQLLAETLVLCLAGGTLGAVIAMWAVNALVAIGPQATPRVDQIAVDWMALAFALAASTLSAVALGLLTTFGGRDVRAMSALSASHRTTESRRGLAARQTLVVVQVALTLVLLAGTGLLARSFVRLLEVNPGYRLDDALVLDLTTANSGVDYRARRVAILDALIERLRELPAVSDIGLITGFPLGGGNYSNGQFLEMTSPEEFKTYDEVLKLGAAVLKARAGQAGFRIASGDYFRAMGIPLVRGRVFNAADVLDSPHVAVITQSLADTKWPGQDPIGRYIQFGNMDGDPHALRIVGVVGDVRELTPEVPPSPLVYASYRQRPNAVWRVSVVIRGPDPTLLAPTVRRAVRDLDPELPVQTRTISSAFDTALSGRRFNLILITAFGATALLLASLGLYGVIAYIVAQRTREIGIRMALGATPRNLLPLLVGTGARLALWGSAAGIVASLALSRVVQGLLFGVSPTDPLVLGGVLLVTLVCALAASYLPARRALRAGPIASLRTP